MSKENDKITVSLKPFAADEIAERVVETLVERLQGEVCKKLDALIRERFDDGIRKAADKAVGDFLKKSLPKTNQWGEGTGQTITITEFVIEDFKKHMQQRVESDGRTATYQNEKNMTRHQWLIEQFGTKQIVEAAKAEVEKIRKAAEAQVSAAVGNFIAQNLVAPVTAHMLPRS